MVILYFQENQIPINHEEHYSLDVRDVYATLDN
jgi:hypothetical protein